MTHSRDFTTPSVWIDISPTSVNLFPPQISFVTAEALSSRLHWKTHPTHDLTTSSKHLTRHSITTVGRRIYKERVSPNTLIDLRLHLRKLIDFCLHRMLSVVTETRFLPKRDYTFDLRYVYSIPVIVLAKCVLRLHQLHLLLNPVWTYNVRPLESNDSVTVVRMVPIYLFILSNLSIESIYPLIHQRTLFLFHSHSNHESNKPDRNYNKKNKRCLSGSFRGRYKRSFPSYCMCSV